jgi:hypothetical protein
MKTKDYGLVTKELVAIFGEKKYQTVQRWVSRSFAKHIRCPSSSRGAYGPAELSQ